MFLIVSTFFLSLMIAAFWAAAKLGVLFYAATATGAITLALLALLIIVAVRGPGERRNGGTTVSLSRDYRRRTGRYAARSRT
jgi:membrane protein implicated in regulation of membrane protease activity